MEAKLRNRKVEGILNRLHVAFPEPRDGKERPPCIPDSVKNKMEVSKKDRKLERHIEEEMGDDYILDLKKNYDIPNEQKYDVVPEIWEGHNVADFIDPDIMEKLEALEAEEELREKAGFYDVEFSSEDEETRETRSLARRIRSKKKIMKKEHELENSNHRASRPVLKRAERSVSRLRKEQKELGVDLDSDDDAHYRRSRSTTRGPPLKKARVDSEGNVTSSRHAVPRDKSGVRDAKQAAKAEKIRKKAQTPLNRQARKGEADRKIVTLKPKHLFVGTRGIGKTSRR